MSTLLTFDDILTAAADSFPDRTALVFPDERVTYRELDDRVEATARRLRSLGVREGTSVATFMTNCVDHLVVLFAAHRLGAMGVPVNTRFRSHELAYVLTDSQVRVVVTSLRGREFSDLPSRLLEALPPGTDTTAPLSLTGYPLLRHLLTIGEEGRPDLRSFESVPDDTTDPVGHAAKGDDPAILLYTSGTTSMPKGCALLHRQLTDIAAQVGERFGSRDGDRIWDALPMFHASSLIPMLAAMLVGGAFISQASPEPKQSLDMIEGERATLLWPAFTQVWQSIVTQPGFGSRSLDSVRGILCIGPLETVHHLEAQLPGVPLLSCYGITEGCGMPTMVRWDDDEAVRLGTGGLPMDGIEARVRDLFTHEPLPAGVTGELQLRGRNVFSGYLRDPEKTAAAFDTEGWFATGDLATLDDAGRITFQGRLKDMLKVGGENVAAIEIEAFLSTHPAVRTVAVVGAPDTRLGEVPAAFVELIEGASATEQELTDYIAGRLASFKVPRYIRFVTEWPMSATKIRKVDLRDRLEHELAPAPAPATS